MLQLKNLTPFESDIAVFPDENGIDAVFPMVKATFNLGREWTLADEQEPLTQVDEYWGEVGQSSVKRCSDYHIGKAATDILIQGHACAHSYQPVQELDVEIQVGVLNHCLKVFGNRFWQNGHITQPQKFEKMPLVYERAFGGRIEQNGETVDSEPSNPVGLGWKSRESNEGVQTIDQHGPNAFDGTPLPNIENPTQLVGSVSDSPVPAGIGPIAPFWHPRASYAGTYDEAWESERAPFLPEDFDKRFLNSAHPELAYPGFLKGGEQVYISNMHPEGAINFILPKVNLAAKVHRSNEASLCAFHLETLAIYPNELKACLTWRAKYSGGKSIGDIDEISVSLQR